MKNNKKISAFTLNEIIVVLIITSIVVGLAFSVLSLVQKHMLAIQDNYKVSSNIQKLKTSLWVDFNRFSNINYDAINNEIILRNDIDSISYKFTKNSIIKVQTRDTFLLSIEKKIFYFDGLVTQKKKFDAIKIILTKAYYNKELFVFKANDATEYIE